MVQMSKQTLHQKFTNGSWAGEKTLQSCVTKVCSQNRSECCHVPTGVAGAQDIAMPHPPVHGGQELGLQRVRTATASDAIWLHAPTSQSKIIFHSVSQRS